MMKPPKARGPSADKPGRALSVETLQAPTEFMRRAPKPLCGNGGLGLRRCRVTVEPNDDPVDVARLFRRLDLIEAEAARLGLTRPPR